MMLNFVVPIVFGLLTAALIKFLIIYRLENMKLKPNCLLTKYPLVFVKKFHFKNFIVKSKELHYLRAHGYETVQLQAHLARNNLTKKALQLQKIYGKVHIIYDPSLSDTVLNLREQLPNAIASAQRLEKLPIEEHLKYAISLAESDFQCSH